MSPSNAQSRRHQSKNRLPRILGVLPPVLLLAVVTCTASVAGSARLDNQSATTHGASDGLLVAVENAHANVVRAQSLADESPPTKPRRRALAKATPTSVTLTWRRSRDNVRVTGYEVSVPGRPRVRTTRTAYTIRSLACRTTYRIGVAAYDAAGNRSPTRWFARSTAACVSLQLQTKKNNNCCRRPSSPSHRKMVRRSRVRSPGP